LDTAECAVQRSRGLCRAVQQCIPPAFDGMTMGTGLHRIELAGFSGLARLTRGGVAGFSGAARNPAAKHLNSRLLWLAAVLIAGFGTWTALSGSSSNPAESEPVRLATAAVTDPGRSAAVEAQKETAQGELAFNAATAEAIAPVERGPLDGLKISSQSWRRGGLGSKALVTFTLRNTNDYAVKDIEIFCSFARRDGSHLTDRKRTIRDTVNMKSRKTFARLHVGYVNINADLAKCSLVAASHV
jgi:hypothetical protein